MSLQHTENGIRELSECINVLKYVVIQFYCHIPKPENVKDEEKYKNRTISFQTSMRWVFISNYIVVLNTI